MTGGAAAKADLERVQTALKTNITRLEAAKVETELKRIKQMGSALLAMLVLPWLTELISSHHALTGSANRVRATSFERVPGCLCVVHGVRHR